MDRICRLKFLTGQVENNVYFNIRNTYVCECKYMYRIYIKKSINVCNIYISYTHIHTFYKDKKINSENGHIVQNILTSL